VRLRTRIVLLLLFLYGTAAVSANEIELEITDLYKVAVYAAQVAKPGLAATNNITWERLRPTRLSNMTCPLIEGTDLGREVRPYIMTLHYGNERYVVYVAGDGTLALPCDSKFDTLTLLIPPTATPLPTMTYTPTGTTTPVATNTPTATATPMATATALPAAVTCPPDFTGFMTPRITLGMATARVGDGGSPNRLRDQPSVSGLQVGQIQPGRTINQVLGGPACSDTYVWWFVEMDGVQGWTVESDSSDGGFYFLEPLEGFAFPTNTPMSVPIVSSATPESVVVPSTSSVPGTLNTVIFNRYSFSYSDVLASSDLNTTVTLYTDDSRQDAPVTQIDLYTDLVPPEYRTWLSNVSIRFYNRADFADSPYIEAIFDQLQTQLTWRPALTSTATTTGDQPLPFLPRQDLSQVIRGHLQYVETETVTGISYVTYLSPGIGPIAQDGYQYTFQGLSKDGSTYISVFAHLNTLAVPEADPDYEKFSAGYDTYLAAALKMLDEATPDQFTPNLNDLDAIVKTIEVK
jgi:hypothetical protein